MIYTKYLPTQIGIYILIFTNGAMNMIIKNIDFNYIYFQINLN